MSPRILLHALLWTAACGAAPARPTAIESPGSATGGAPDPTTGGSSTICLAGDCRDGKGVATYGRGAARVIYDGTFVAGKPGGDATIHRVAGETIESLEIDSRARTGTLRHPNFTVLGEVIGELPQLSDESAAVMLPTGEWFFAEWTPTMVAARDSNLTGARTIPKVPDDYGDLLAGVILLEDATHTGRDLELRPPGTLPDGEGTKPRPFARRIAIAPFTVFVPDPAEPVAYIVGIGVVDPASPAIARLRDGGTPTGEIPILRADGKVATLEIADGVVTRWPTWHTPPKTWLATLKARAATVARQRVTIDAQLANARAAVALADASAAHAALRSALAELTPALAQVTEAVAESLELVPGTEAARITRLRALHRAASTATSRADLAARIVAAADTAHVTPELTTVLADLVAQLDVSQLDASSFE